MTEEAAKEAKINPISSLEQPLESRYRDNVGKSMSKPKKIKKLITMKVTKVKFQRGGLGLTKRASRLESFEAPEDIMDLGFGALSA
jgi:hypothetical protein